jgi:benzoyl-CoA reductase subunit B
MADYKTEPLKLWNRAKEIRSDFYKRYATAHDRGALRIAGGAWTFDAVPAGLEGEVAFLTSEPYGASLAFNKPLMLRCLEAADKYGYARDLCSYMRGYWGSILIDEYAFGGPFPRPDILWQDHICCSHAKWYQVVNEIEGGNIPFYCVDMGAGSYETHDENSINYVVGQLMDGIEFLEQSTGRKFNDEKFIEACWNDFESTHWWAKVCELNQAVPAPLEEKSMYSLYVLCTLEKSRKEIADFMKELYHEVKDRVDRGIAAVPKEKVRVMSDTQPPWGFLSIFRYMEDLGCISVGSLYTFGLLGMWIWDENRKFVPRPLPPAKPTSRDEALKMLVDWHMSKPEYQHFYHAKYKSEMMIAIARQWKLNGVMLHYNRGCEGLTMGIAENRLALIDAGYPVMTFEGNMGDEREFDPERTKARIDAFMETLGVKKPS